MADQIIQCKVTLSRDFSADEMERFCHRLREAASAHHIWAKLYDSVRYATSSEEAARVIRFEIVDDEEASEANRILRGIWYSDDGRIAYWGESGVPDVQAFAQAMTDMPDVASLHLTFQFAHGSPEPIPTVRIRASEICVALMSRQSEFHVPIMRLEINR